MASTEPLPLNLDFWYQVVNFFFLKCGKLRSENQGTWWYHELLQSFIKSY